MRITVNSLPQELRSLRLRPSFAVRWYCEHTFVPRRRSSDDTSAVSQLFGKGLSDYEIGRRTGISRSSVQRWRTKGVPRRGRSRPLEWRPPDPCSYSYLLGIYLGDGYLSKASTPSPVLEISLDPQYPGIVDECLAAIQCTVETKPRSLPTNDPERRSDSLGRGESPLAAGLPSARAGKKHERAIALANWQQDLVDRFPRQFLRGFIHADGSRVVNRFQVSLASGPRDYAYPRYFFTNLSRDIQRLFCDSCEQMGIRWTRSSVKNISVADRRSVALLDSFIGPKS